MLLGNNGRVWVHFDAPGNGPASWQLYTPLMRAHIGRPLRTARKVRGYLKGGVYRRAFSKGLVIVNPTSRTVVVHLRRAARLTGGQRVTTGDSGTILGRRVDPLKRPSRLRIGVRLSRYGSGGILDQGARDGLVEDCDGGRSVDRDGVLERR